jgi:hypothetical protein
VAGHGKTQSRHQRFIACSDPFSADVSLHNGEPFRIDAGHFEQ